MKTDTLVRLTRSVASGAVLASLSGCFAVFIPGSVIDAAVGAPKFCIAKYDAGVGDSFTIDGRPYRVTRVAGPSPYYCRNNPEGRRFGVDGEPT